jgi:hypothetical protein
LPFNDLPGEISGTAGRIGEVRLEKGAFYASLKIIGRLDEALRVEPAELLKRGAIEKERR